jgi:hypothetical protein
MKRYNKIKELIGDFRKKFIMKMMEGSNKDIKKIYEDKLDYILNGVLSEKVEYYVIID